VLADRGESSRAARAAACRLAEASPQGGMLVPGEPGSLVGADVAMRPHLPRPFSSNAALARTESERSLAEVWLGAHHPLVCLLRRFETACAQLVSVTAVQAAGVVFLVGDWPVGLSLAIAAAVVQVALGCRLAALRMLRRELSLELIANGGAGLPLPCIERLCRRLLDGRRLERTASSVDEMVKTAVHPGALRAAARPLADPRVIRATAPELRQVAALLRDGPAVRGVALVEWLLSSPATPLYGMEVEPLRQELVRVRYLLTHEREWRGDDRKAPAPDWRS
jgi:hypothetical protein